LISALVRFSGPQRFEALIIWPLILRVFYIAVPIFGPSNLIRLVKGKLARSSRPPAV
jgi:hypothetical protein